jgi:hypothetical protein
MLVLPWHMTDPVVQGLNVTLPTDARVLDASLGAGGNAWLDLASLYSQCHATSRRARSR